MKIMIQMAILAAVLAPTVTFAHPHAARPAPAQPIRVAPALRHHPGPRPPHPTPPTKPAPPWRHPHPPGRPHPRPTSPVVYVVAAGYSPAGSVVQQTTYNTQAQPEVSGQRVLSTREFLQVRDLYRGRRVAVCGTVTQSVRGMGGPDYYILDGVVRCDFPRDAQSANGIHVGTGNYVTVTGTVVGDCRATASTDLVECAHAF